MQGESLTALAQAGITPLTFGFFLSVPSQLHNENSVPLCRLLVTLGSWTQAETLTLQQAATLNPRYG